MLKKKLANSFAMKDLGVAKKILGKSAIHLTKNSTFHSKTKHIQLRYHFIRSALEDGHLKLEKKHTSQNLADMLTKGVTREKLSSCSVSVGLQE